MSEVQQEQAAPAPANGLNGTATQEEEVRLMTEEELEREKMRPPDIDQDMKVSCCWWWYWWCCWWWWWCW